MNTNKYFQDELSYLKESGHEFSKHHPQLTQFLSESTNDPDVERLLEGFAFLSGRLRQKLDDELPELTQSLMTLLWPHYTRSIPSMCITELTPHAGSVTEKTTVKLGAEMGSEQVEGTQCVFNTCYDVDLFPIEINSIHQANTRSSSTISINIATEHGIELSRIGLDKLRFYINGELHISRLLYLWMFRYLERVDVDLGGGVTRTITPKSIKPVGFAEGESLLPYGENSFSGYRFLQEYFALPEKYMFFDVDDLDWVSGVPQRSTMKLSFVFNRALPAEVVVKDKHFKLHCAPAVNLFSKDADPLNYDLKKTEYRVRPQTRQQDHFEVYSVEHVEGWSKTQRKKQVILPFESFEHQIGSSNKEAFYKTKVTERISGKGLDFYISFISHDNDLASLSTETVLMKLVCSNGPLPERLSIGDITHTTHKSPNYASFTNITKPTASVSPQLDGTLHWQLIANMSLNYLSLSNIDVLKTLLGTYDFHSRIDRQTQRASQKRLDGIKGVQMKPVDRIYRGVAVRGIKISMTMDANMFANEGDMYLLASILNEFITLYASINSFTEFEVTNEQNGEVYSWQSKMGMQTVI